MATPRNRFYCSSHQRGHGSWRGRLGKPHVSPARIQFDWHRLIRFSPSPSPPVHPPRPRRSQNLIFRAGGVRGISNSAPAAPEAGAESYTSRLRPARNLYSAPEACAPHSAPEVRAESLSPRSSCAWTEACIDFWLSFLGILSGHPFAVPLKLFDQAIFVGSLLKNFREISNKPLQNLVNTWNKSFDTSTFLFWEACQ